MGLPEYSYYFVLREFRPVLERLGEVILVEDPQREVDAHYASARATGEPCVFLSFSPPHRTCLELACPTVPVFAWEFDSIPSESWLDEPQQDWRHGLRHCGRAIVHSWLTRDTVCEAMDDRFPVIAIPAPVWDKFAPLRERDPAQRPGGPWVLELPAGVVFDTHCLSLEPWMPGLDAVAQAVAVARGEIPAQSLADAVPMVQAETAVEAAPPAVASGRLKMTLRYLAEWYRLVWRDRLPDAFDHGLRALRRRGRPVPPPAAPAPEPLVDAEPPLSPWDLAPRRLELDGVIFTAMFNPYDGRKNWVDMLTAFCTAFRDQPEATLLFKLGHSKYHSAINDMLMCMARLPAFRCRVILLQGYLEAADFEALIDATAFVVNASHGEGQCLPLMEFMSCGKPAIAPQHSAMADYMDEEVGFVVDSWLDATAWPHDPRLAYRTLRHQIDWQSLLEAYQEAYRTFREEPGRYRALAANAVERMRGHCSQAVAEERLRRFLTIDEDVDA
nr:glycosyltransferase [Pseudomonas sp. RIT-PI-AD]